MFFWLMLKWFNAIWKISDIFFNKGFESKFFSTKKAKFVSKIVWCQWWPVGDSNSCVPEWESGVLTTSPTGRIFLMNIFKMVTRRRFELLHASVKNWGVNHFTNGPINLTKCQKWRPILDSNQWPST